MHYAFIIDDYLPDSTRVGAKMFHELALQFQDSGHKVTVITPSINQTKPLIVDEYENVTIWRFKSGQIKDISKIKRALNETLLSLRAWSAVKGVIQSDTFDGVIYYSPSIFWGGIVKKIKARCKCPSYLVLRDLFPQWVIDSGMIREGSLIERYFRYFESYSYKQADTIGLMSEKNLSLFQSINPQYTCQVLRNWANVFPLSKEDVSSSIRHKLSLQNKVIYFYGGNIGHAQDMANLMRLVRGMKDNLSAHFLFIGQGDEVGLINELAIKWELNNFTYLESVDQSTFKQILAEVDVGLFSLSAKHSAHNFPGKLLGYMVESLPILGSVNYGNDLKDIVNNSNAGFIHLNGEDDKLLESAKNLYHDFLFRNEIGRNSYKLLKEQFSVDSAYQTIEYTIRDV